ncbi:dienelactone hydrolase family protein [Pendulispora rubella]|uniref:Dienelactone hydrolase family protein n=1 Tax=Pendulispora rubella TaxID=2741070 RepID=A0ABZ2L3K1_9BACT
MRRSRDVGTSFEWLVRAALCLALGASACAKPSDDGKKGALEEVDAGHEPGEVHFRSGPYLLRGFVVKPAGAGPFPVVVYNHGSEAEPSIEWAGALADWFRGHGFVFFMPYRRGSLGSEGPYWEDVVGRHPVGERVRALVDEMDAQNADVVAAIDWIREQPYADRARVSVAGCSFGGIQTVLTAEKDLGLSAAVDFAGASATWATSPELQVRLKKAVSDAKVPVFFVQAQNDYDTTPSRALAEAMAAAEKPHRMRIFPRFGTTPREGHGKFCGYGMNAWGEDVLLFLRQPPR